MFESTTFVLTARSLEFSCNELSLVYRPLIYLYTMWIVFTIMANINEMSTRMTNYCLFRSYSNQNMKHMIDVYPAYYSSRPNAREQVVGWCYYTILCNSFIGWNRWYPCSFHLYRTSKQQNIWKVMEKTTAGIGKLSRSILQAIYNYNLFVKVRNTKAKLRNLTCEDAKIRTLLFH